MTNSKLKLTITILTVFVNTLVASNQLSLVKGFVENKGQILNQNNQLNSEIKFLLNGNELNVLLKKNSFSYDTYKVKKIEKDSDLLNEIDDYEMDYYKSDSYEFIYTFNRIDIEFLNANPNPEIIAENIQPSYQNFYTYQTRNNEATFVKSFSKVTYKNIYNGIDLEFLATSLLNKPFEYNFIVHPGADPSVIRIKYNGVDFSELKDNTIKLYVPNGLVEEKIPITYLLESGKVCSAFYKKNGLNTYGIKIDGINKNETLIIDPLPVLSWGSYFGHTELEEILNIQTDNYGNVYSIGRTKSLINIATNNAYSTVYNGGSSDAMLAKFSLNGQLLWCTYYGGNEFDYGWDVTTVDTNLYIIGETKSATNISTIGSYQPQFAGGNSDAFVCRFTQSGIRVWGTYFGGSHTEYTRGISNDGTNIYITGRTSSLNNIATTGAQQTIFSGVTDAYMSSFSNNGSLLWSTYFGGNGLDLGRDIITDNSGSIILIGSTRSASGMATPGSQKTFLSGIMDAFVAKFSNTGSLIWSTYFGGNESDDAVSVCSDSQQNIYIMGNTSSLNGISTSSSHQITFGGGINDAFLAKFTKNGNLIYGTYYGGAGNDRGYAVTTNLNDEVLVAGSTTSLNNISTSGAMQTNIAGGFDVFLTKFNKLGQRLWGSYYGGMEDDIPHSIAIVPIAAYCDFFVGGWTFSSLGISTLSSFQPIFSGGLLSDAFLTRFKTCIPGGGTSTSQNIIHNQIQFNNINENTIEEYLVNNFSNEAVVKINVSETPSIINVQANLDIQEIQSMKSQH